MPLHELHETKKKQTNKKQTHQVEEEVCERWREAVWADRLREVPWEEEEVPWEVPWEEEEEANRQMKQQMKQQDEEKRLHEQLEKGVRMSCGIKKHCWRVPDEGSE